MANEKISGLTASTTIDQADLLVMVDVSDTTMGPGGTNKKITKENIFTNPAITTPTISGGSIGDDAITKVRGNKEVVYISTGTSYTTTADDYGKIFVINSTDVVSPAKFFFNLTSIASDNNSAGCSIGILNNAVAQVQIFAADESTVYWGNNLLDWLNYVELVQATTGNEPAQNQWFQVGMTAAAAPTNYVYACPVGGAAAYPVFRALVPEDLPAQPLTWVDVPAYSSKWTSTVQVAKFSGDSLAIMKGDFVSTADSNDDPCGTFPTGFEGGFSIPVSALIASSNTLTDMGTSGSTLGVSSTVNTGDKIFCFITYALSS
jgi:hypothetical protein